ncbi:Methyltransferase domain-containing protein [Geodermatophilus pulveris]|uniref:Methyltransferase domain-containing protein n=1 Tax=Geodermatophilus pulveris TaxID=1564159 RepID=A0A239IJR2_9ACTN|nr:class I SAM-dependent methyltransferase [Geodermatophilus pulveris]SNS93847.1 Methyltransferase domain-containing protein [Geodermatophilus pulveris]
MTAAEPSPARWAGASDDAAADFARLGPLLWDPVGRATVAAVDLRPGQRVLDACCGDGASAVPAAHAVGSPGHVDAVDLSPVMVGLLRRRAGDLPQLTGTAADVTTWAGEGYDAVLCVLGAFSLPDMDAGTAHLVRRPRPGGLVSVTSWRPGAMVAPGMALARAVARERGEPVPGDPPRGRLQELGAPDALAGWFAGRGAAGVEVTTVPHTLPATDDALWLLVLGSAFRGMLAGLDDDAVGRVRADYLGQLAGGPPVDATTLVAVGSRAG